MSMSELIKKNEAKEIANTKFVIVVERKEGRGKNAKSLYHNFEDGQDYEFYDHLPKGKKYRVICKQSGANWWYNDDIFINYTKASDLTEVDYDTVEYEGVKLLLVKICTFNIRATLTTAEEKRSWRVVSKLYIDDKKKVYHDAEFTWGSRGQDEYIQRTFRDIYSKYTFKNMSVIDEFTSDYYSGSEKLVAAAKKMGWGIVNLGANNQVILKNGYVLEDFLKYKEPVKKNGPKQRHIDELVSYELEEIHPSKFKMKKVERNWELQEELKKNDFSNISAVLGYDKPICCYRTFKRFEDGSYQEGARIYIEESGKFTACRKNNLGEWINLSMSNNASDFDYHLSYVNKKACENTVLEYLIPMFASSKESENAGAIIASTLRHPCIEKLYKGGFKEIILDAAEASYTKIWDGIENRLGGLNENGKTVNAIIGLNKNQIKLIDEKMESVDLTNIRIFKTKYDIISWVKVCFGNSLLTDIDNKTFSEMLDAMIEAVKFQEDVEQNGIADSKGEMHFAGWNRHIDYYNRIDCDAALLFRTYELVAKEYPLATLRAIVPKALKLFKTYQEEEKTRYDYSRSYTYGSSRREIPYLALTNSLNNYKSYLDMVHKLSEMAADEVRNRKPSPHFSSPEEARMLHDDILPVFNYYQNLEWERRREARMAQYAISQKEKAEKQNSKWETIKSQWDKWLYNNEEYSVVKPETPYDLVVEGTTLGHCVGGYIDRVVNRKTNILFIRKTDDLTKPLFTVEILSNGVIEQIHGRSNSNMDDKTVVAEEPNLIKFVMDWVEEKNLELHTINKVR